MLSGCASVRPNVNSTGSVRVTPRPQPLMTPSSRSPARAGGFQLCQPHVAVKILCGVVHKYEIQSVHPEAIEAALDRFQCTLFRVVIDHTVGPPEFKHLGIAL